MIRTGTGLTLVLASIGAQAALLGRLPATPSGTDYQAYYDTVSDLTWLADANLGMSQPFGLPYGNGTLPGYITYAPGFPEYHGTMSWYTAVQWIAGMNAANYLGTNNWRLPTMIDTAAPGCDFGYSGTDCGFSTTTGELGRLYYTSLGNVPAIAPDGRTYNCPSHAPYCLANPGPFFNLDYNDIFWYGTEYAGYENSVAWAFAFCCGRQETYGKNSQLSVWAVLDGDIANAVPVPAAVWLLGSALGVLGVVRRRSAT